jgi:hypothetical protein
VIGRWSGVTYASGHLHAEKELRLVAQSDAEHYGDQTRRGKANAADVMRAERKPALIGRRTASGRIRPGTLDCIFVTLDPYCK